MYENNKYWSHMYVCLFPSPFLIACALQCTIPAPVDGVSTLSMSNNQTCVCQNSNISNAEDKRFYLGIDPSECARGDIIVDVWHGVTSL